MSQKEEGLDRFGEQLKVERPGRGLGNGFQLPTPKNRSLGVLSRVLGGVTDSASQDLLLYQFSL